MLYSNICAGKFLSRPNRFIAYVEIAGKEEICHVKNTGRCKELLVPGCTVYCQKFDSTARKTKYDLIAVEKGSRLINMDSQAPNKAVLSWLQKGGLGEISQIKPETTYGNSRFDFSFQKDGNTCYLEVKGVTLEQDGVCAFPDAPTLRGTKHLQELSAAATDGKKAYVLFVIQMQDVQYLHPNDATDPAFSAALRASAQAGVEILAMDCAVTPDSMSLRQSVPVCL